MNPNNRLEDDSLENVTGGEGYQFDHHARQDLDVKAAGPGRGNGQNLWFNDLVDKIQKQYEEPENKQKTKTGAKQLRSYICDAPVGR